MEIEILGFHPIEFDAKKRHLIATLKILLKDYNMTLLGVRVHQKGDKYFIMMPCGKGWDYEQRKQVWYPMIAMTDSNQYKDFLDSVRSAFIGYFTTLLKDPNYVMVLPEKKPIHKKLMSKKIPTNKTTQETKIGNKVWATPPPCKFRRSRPG